MSKCKEIFYSNNPVPVLPINVADITETWNRALKYWLMM